VISIVNCSRGLALYNKKVQKSQTPNDTDALPVYIMSLHILLSIKPLVL
jgi:hypothetical protein